MHYIIAILILIVNFIFQSTLLQHFSIGGILPSTTLIIVAIIAVFRGKYEGAALGLVAGLMQDILFSTTIGVNALIYFLIGYVLGLLGEKVFKESWFLPLITIILSTISYHVLYYLFMVFLSVDVSFTSIIRSVVIKETIYNTIIGTIVYMLIIKALDRPQIMYKGKH